MYGLMLMALNLTPSCDSIRLEEDVWEMRDSDFQLPFAVDGRRREDIDHVVIYVSEDRGKSWKRHAEATPREDRVPFNAPHDGLYWFAIQAIDKDGNAEPAETEDLVPSQKVYVNTAHKTLKFPKKSNKELREEIADLRREVFELKKRLGDLEAARRGQ